MYTFINHSTFDLLRSKVSEAEPHMRRFEGGWATEEIMKRILRNSRDTASRREKNAQSFKVCCTLLLNSLDAKPINCSPGS